MGEGDEGTRARSRVLVVGARGFVGSAVARALRRRGHVVVGTAREPRDGLVAADLERDRASDWALRLAGVDAVVNAAGAIGGDLEALHATGPTALFEACAASGVPTVVQVSALGAGECPWSPFLAGKAQGDAALLRLGAGRPGWRVARPSIVVGRGGATTATFLSLAATPAPTRLAEGRWRLQPIHVDDLAEVVADLVEGAASPPVVAAGGPEVLTTDELTATLRAWLGLRPARPVPLPGPLLRAAAATLGRLPGARLTPETLALLARGSVADDLDPVVARRVRPIAEALRDSPAGPGDLAEARAAWLRPTLLACLAAVWLGTGVASLLVTAERSDALLGGLGLSGWPAAAATATGALLDLALGVAMLAPRLRARALRAQVALVAAYTALATVALPGLWLDPFAPLLKNLAVVGATLALLAWER